MAAGNNEPDAPKTLSGDASPFEFQPFNELDADLEVDPFVREVRFQPDS